MLETKDLGYWYTNKKDYLYKDINLTFEAGKTYAILGASGTGKTTFLSLISGLDVPKAGDILFNGESLKKIGLQNYRRNDVSIIFQSYNLLPYMSALDNVLTAMEISKSNQSNKRQYALESLAKVGLTEDLALKKVTLLSGGQQQRVAIVRALCSDHQLIVADEPTGNLDEENSKEIIRLFQKIAHDEGKCIVIVTHEQEVAKVCDTVYELKQKEFQVKENIAV